VCERQARRRYSVKQARSMNAIGGGKR
jgi:hypothetical protein